MNRINVTPQIEAAYRWRLRPTEPLVIDTTHAIGAAQWTIPMEAASGVASVVVRSQGEVRSVPFHYVERPGHRHIQIDETLIQGDIIEFHFVENLT